MDKVVKKRKVSAETISEITKLKNTEWDTLKEVVIGNVENFHMRNLDNVFSYIYGFLRNFQNNKKFTNNYKIDRKFVKERQEDLDNLQKVLEAEGVRVLRTDSMKSTKIKTPYFSSDTNDCGCVRDMFLIIKDLIIETPTTDRRRYFESLLLHKILKRYFKQGFKWISAPKTFLQDKNVDFKAWSNVKYDIRNKIENIEEDFEIAFDGANCLKFGKDILMNIGNKNHELGAYWLQSVLGNEYKIHTVRLTDSHIDGLIVPIDGKTLLMNPTMKDKLKLLPDFLKGWKIIYVEDDYKDFNYSKNHLQLSSFRGMDTNVLAIGDKRVIIRDSAKRTIERLKSQGFRPIPVRLRHCEIFGGGPHCVTLDIVRV